MKKRQETLNGILFILPSFLGFAIFVFLPTFFSLVLSFTKWDFVTTLDKIKFIGIDNFIEIFKDEWFISSLINNLKFAMVVLPAGTILSLICAVIINKFIYGKNIFKVLFFLPYISSIVAISVVFGMMFHPSQGPVNQFLMSLGVTNPPKWLGDMKWALSVIMIISIWHNLGYNIIIYIAALTGIPKELYESADIDGATPFKQFLKITIPMVSSTTFFLVIMGIIGSFKVFDIISVLTDGGPGQATTVIAFLIYRSAFIYGKMGYASAIAWVMFLIIFIVTIFQWIMQKRFVNYD